MPENLQGLHGIQYIQGLGILCFFFLSIHPLDQIQIYKEKKGTSPIEVWGNSVLILYSNVTQQTSFSSTQSAQQIAGYMIPSVTLLNPGGWLLQLHHSAPHLKTDSPPCLTCVPHVELCRLQDLHSLNNGFQLSLPNRKHQQGTDLVIPLVKDPPSNAGDMGSIPDRGNISHVLRSN